MFSDIYGLYNKCFPAYEMTEEGFNDWLCPEKAHIIRAFNNEKLAGFSMLHGNSIVLLCVDEKERGKGLGSKLLKESEEHIKSTGAEKIILGHGAYYVFQGVPAENPASVSFFEKRGYSAEWTSVNMGIRLADFDASVLNIPPKPDSVTFRFAEDADKPELLKAVEDADSDYSGSNWVRIFKDCEAPVMLAVQNNEIMGFQILDTDGTRFSMAGEKVAAIGCVGVIHKARELGIGRRMVVEGMEWLREQGSTFVELLYVEIVDWYKKLGFYVTGEQWMGEKIFYKHDNQLSY